MPHKSFVKLLSEWNAWMCAVRYYPIVGMPWHTILQSMLKEPPFLCQLFTMINFITFLCTTLCYIILTILNTILMQLSIDMCMSLRVRGVYLLLHVDVMRIISVIYLIENQLIFFFLKTRNIELFKSTTQ